MPRFARHSLLAFLSLMLCGLLLVTGYYRLIKRPLPEVPFIGERVLLLSHYNGDKEVFMDGMMSYGLRLVQNRYDDVMLHDTLYRHVSLALDQEGNGSGERGMIGNLEDRAEANGWDIVHSLSVDASGFSSLLTIEKNGFVLAFLGLDDAFVLLPENPGVSREAGGRRWTCETEASSDRRDIGPCEIGGFAPVYVFSNLTNRKGWFRSYTLSEERLRSLLLGGKEERHKYPRDTVNRALTWKELNP